MDAFILLNFFLVGVSKILFVVFCYSPPCYVLSLVAIQFLYGFNQ